jgi:hypothetical protein
MTALKERLAKAIQKYNGKVHLSFQRSGGHGYSAQDCFVHAHYIQDGQQVNEVVDSIKGHPFSDRDVYKLLGEGVDACDVSIGNVILDATTKFGLRSFRLPVDKRYIRCAGAMIDAVGRELLFGKHVGWYTAELEMSPTLTMRASMLQDRGPVAEAMLWLLWLEEVGFALYEGAPELAGLPSFHHVRRLNRERVSWRGATEILAFVAKYSDNLNRLQERVLSQLEEKRQRLDPVMSVAGRLVLPSPSIEALSGTATELVDTADRLYNKQMEKKGQDYPNSVLYETKKEMGTIEFSLRNLAKVDGIKADDVVLTRVQSAFDMVKSFRQEINDSPLYLLAQFFDPRVKGKLTGDSIKKAKAEAKTLRKLDPRTKSTLADFNKDLTGYYEKEDKDAGGLDFWVRTGRSRYPTIAAMAIDVLSLPSLASDPGSTRRTESAPASSVAKRGPPSPLASPSSAKRRQAVSSDAGQCGDASADDSEDLDLPPRPRKRVTFATPQTPNASHSPPSPTHMPAERLRRDQGSSRIDSREVDLGNASDSPQDWRVRDYSDGVGSDVTTEDEETSEGGADALDDVIIIDAMFNEEAPTEVCNTGTASNAEDVQVAPISSAREPLLAPGSSGSQAQLSQMHEMN